MGDSSSAGVVWLFFGVLAPILFLLKFLIVLFVANFLANYYVLFGKIGEEAEESECKRFSLSLLSSTLSTCLFPVAWLGLGALLERYL